MGLESIKEGGKKAEFRETRPTPGPQVTVTFYSLSVYHWRRLGGTRCSFGPNGSIGAKISVQGVHGRVKNKVAVRAALEMAFDLGLHAL
jgi:hypothetical protein